MTYFQARSLFGHCSARSLPRLFPDQFGQIAEDIDFESGALKPITGDSASVHTLQDGSKQSIYYYREASWLEFAQDYVHAQKSPVPGDILDRLYWTGEGTGAGAYPRMGTASNIVSGSAWLPSNFFSTRCSCSFRCSPYPNRIGYG